MPSLNMHELTVAEQINSVYSLTLHSYMFDKSKIIKDEMKFNSHFFFFIFSFSCKKRLKF